MHELSIALRVIAIATEALPPDAPDLRVASIRLRIGRLTAVVPESLRLCFEVASRDTRVAGATLDIAEVPIVVACRGCAAETEQEDFPLVCGSCGSDAVDLVAGRELSVDALEVADP